MSTIFLHIGQCGNQLGEAFWKEVEEWYHGAASKQKHPYKRLEKPTSASSGTVQLPFALLEGTLPCIMVDTEPKVVRKCSKSGILSLQVPPEFRIVDKTGRGNNWACGYSGGATPSGRSLVTSVQECVRKLVEKCDRFTGSMVFHSIAGGTGSGLTSAILEFLREDYPLSYILSTPIAPFSFGETPLQHYNALLCLSWLQEYADGVLLFQNDYVLEQSLKCITGPGSERGGASKRETKTASVDDMNGLIVHALCNSLLPLWDAKQRRTHGDLGELVRALCADPALKFITPTHAQFSRPGSTWDQTVASVTQLYSGRKDLTGSRKGKPSTASMVLVARGSQSTVDSVIYNMSAIERKLKQVYNTVEWNPFPVDFWFSREPRLMDRKVATVLANSSTVNNYFDLVIQRAAPMYQERAYLHWYEKYGCGKSFFDEGFAAVQNMIDSYSQLHS